MTDTRMNQIADKIQKLLALAGNNPSEAEAQAALLKAQALIAKYNVDMEALNEEEAIKYEFLQTKIKAHKFSNHLASILANSFACKVIIVDSKVCFFGRSDNAKAVVSAMQFAHSVMVKGGNKATREHGIQPGHQGAAYVYNSYVVGFLTGLKSVMDAQTVALAVIVPEDVNKEFSKMFQNTRPVRQSRTKAAFVHSAYESGMADGTSVMNRRSLQK